MHKTLLDIIVCPLCHTKLFVNTTKTGLICTFENIIFPIIHGIPILLKERSQKLLQKK